MAGISEYTKAGIISTYFINGGTGRYFALMTTDPDDSNVGGVEVTGGSYARQAMTFATGGGHRTWNLTQINFTGMPACTVRAAAIFDAVSGGNMISHGLLSLAKSVNVGGTFITVVGDVVIDLG